MASGVLSMLTEKRQQPQYPLPSPRVVELAEYILSKQGAMSANKLQKLCYYSQAWALAWDGEALFEDEIHAWANGPVVTSLYPLHKGRYLVHPGEIRLMALALSTRPAVCWDASERAWMWIVPLDAERSVLSTDESRSGMLCMRIGHESTASLAADKAREELRASVLRALDALAGR